MRRLTISTVTTLRRKFVIGALIAVLPLCAAAASQCPLTERNLIGGWKRASHGGFFEVMAFEIDGNSRSFNSWMHQRPEFIDASWKLENCRIVITHSDPRMSVTFIVKRASADRLYLVEQGEKGTVVYRRIRERAKR